MPPVQCASARSAVASTSADPGSLGSIWRYSAESDILLAAWWPAAIAAGAGSVTAARLSTVSVSKMIGF